MAKTFAKTQDLSRGVYLTARQQVLRSIGKTVEQLDALYAKDAAKLKLELARLFKISGIPQRRAAKIIDDVLAGSRAQRVEVVRKAIENAARVGRKLDKATFDTVFGKDPDTKKAAGRSGLRLIGTPSPQRAIGSEDKSASTN